MDGIELAEDVTAAEVDALAERMTELHDGSRFEKTWHVYRLRRPNGTDHADEVRGSPLYLDETTTRQQPREWVEAGDLATSSVMLFWLVDTPVDVIVLDDDDDDDEMVAALQEEHAGDPLFEGSTFREWNDGDDWSP